MGGGIIPAARNSERECSGSGLSVHRRGSALLMITPDCVFFSDRVRSKCRWQTVQVQSVLGNVRSVRCACNKKYHTLKNYKLLFRYLIGQIAGQLIQKWAHVFYYGTVIY